MREQDINDLFNHVTEIKIVQYFQNNVQVDNGKCYINYPANFFFPLTANSEDELFELFMNELNNTVKTEGQVNINY